MLYFYESVVYLILNSCFNQISFTERKNIISQKNYFSAKNPIGKKSRSKPNCSCSECRVCQVVVVVVVVVAATKVTMMSSSTSSMTSTSSTSSTSMVSPVMSKRASSLPFCSACVIWISKKRRMVSRSQPQLFAIRQFPCRWRSSQD